MTDPGRRPREPVLASEVTAVFGVPMKGAVRMLGFSFFTDPPWWFIVVLLVALLGLVVLLFIMRKSQRED